MIQRNVTGRFQGSYLGVGWAAAQPLLMLAVYTYVFGVVFRARWRPDATSQVEFALTMFCGLIPFGILSETAGAAPGTIIAHAGYVKRVVFPLEILPVVVVGTSLVQAVINTIILLVTASLFLRLPPLTALLLPVAGVPVVLLALGMAWLLAALGVFVRDTASVVGIVMQLLFFATPILYPASSVPESFRPLVYWNPVATLVDTWRGLALGVTPVPWMRLAVVTAGAALLAIVGRGLFVRAQPAFADVV